MRAKDKGLAEVTVRYDALLRFASLQLGRRLGTEVVPVVSRRELQDPTIRSTMLTESLVKNGTLEGAIRVPGTVNPLVVTVDLRAGRVTCHVDVDAPREGRPTTRVNWLLRQLRNAPETVRIEAHTAHSRGLGQADLLKAVRADPSILLGDGQRELRSFRIALSSPVASKRGRGRGTLIDSVLDAIDHFYGDVLQQLKAWSAAPPRLREPLQDPLVPGTSALTSNALSSQDGVELADEPAVSSAPAEGVDSAVDHDERPPELAEASLGL